MDRWARDFDSWDICDECCGNLLDKTRFAYDKAITWSGTDEEYMKSSGFVMMACLAVHDREMNDPDFARFLPIIERESTDERNFVKKAVNWALRQIGERNKKLNRYAIIACSRIRARDSRSARWIAADAMRELTSKAVRERLDGR